MMPLLEALEIVLIAFGVLLLADFLSGVFHWLEDSYWHEDTPIVGALVVRANVIHHFDPRHMTRHSRLASAKGPMAGAALGLTLLYMAGLLSWPVGLLALIGANANEIHKWAHRSAAENGRVIASLQRIGILQSRAHHTSHPPAEQGHQLLRRDQRPKSAPGADALLARVGGGCLPGGAGAAPSRPIDHGEAKSLSRASLFGPRLLAAA